MGPALTAALTALALATAEYLRIQTDHLQRRRGRKRTRREDRNRSG
jgi:hypothetical protein